MRKTGFAFGFVVLSIASACSGGSATNEGRGGGTGATSVTSVDTSKTPAQLSETEVAQFCKDVSAYGASFLADATFRRYSCSATSAVAAKTKGAKTDDELRAECRAQVETCLAKPVSSGNDSSSDMKDEADCTSQVKSSPCTAKLSEYTQCLYEQYEAYRSIAATTDFCATITVTGATPKAPDPTTPASCTALAAKCPDLEL